MAASSRVFGACRAMMAKSSPLASSAGATSGRGIQKVVPVSQPLARFIGASEVSRTTAVKKVWEYIKLHNLQNPANKKEVFCDDKLKTIFDGNDKVGFTEVPKFLSKHFPKSG